MTKRLQEVVQISVSSISYAFRCHAKREDDFPGVVIDLRPLFMLSGALNSELLM